MVSKTRLRLLVLCAVAMIAASAAYAAHRPEVGFASDWDEIWSAGRALLRGQDPYLAVQDAYGAGKFDYPLVYPGTAVVLSLPFALLPLPLALALWSGLGSGGLAWVLSKRGWWGLLGLCSVPFFFAFMLVQWSPLLTAAVAFPWAGLVWAAKPTIGIPLFLAWPSRSAAVGCAVLLILSIILMPHWPAAMAENMRTVPHVRSMVLRPGGFLLLLALLGWRTPEGRLLAALAIIPQTTHPYELVPLVLIPQTWRRMTLFVVLTLIAFFLFRLLPPLPPGATFGMALDRNWPVWLLVVYLPCLWMILHRPGSGGWRFPRASQDIPVGGEQQGKALVDRGTP